jgi:hypothetical protein
MDYGARYYDPQLGRWHVPDPEDQFGSPYLAMGNNPVSYLDPDGRFAFVPIIIGAMIGGFLGHMQASMQGKNELGGFATGAVMGAAGGFAGAFAPIGIPQGIAYGATTGSVLGATQAGLTGGDPGQGALWGGITGGVLGGISGGIAAHKAGADLWSGRKISYYRASNSNFNNLMDENLEISDSYLHKFFKEQFGEAAYKKLGTLSMKTPNWQSSRGGDNWYVDEQGFFISVDKDSYSSGQMLGVTRSSPWSLGRGDIRIAPAAFKNKFMLFSTVGHEYIHTSHINMGLAIHPLHSNYTETVAYSWEIKVAQMNTNPLYNGSAQQTLKNASLWRRVYSVDIASKLNSDLFRVYKSVLDNMPYQLR